MKKVNIEHMKQFYQYELKKTSDPIDLVYISLSILDKGLPDGQFWVQEILTKAIGISDASEPLLLIIDTMFKYNCLGNKVWCKRNYINALKKIYSWEDYFIEKNRIINHKVEMAEIRQLFKKILKGVDDPNKLIILSSMIADKKYLGDNIWAKSLLKKAWKKRLSDEDFVLSVQSSFDPEYYEGDILWEEIVNTFKNRHDCVP